VLLLYSNLGNTLKAMGRLDEAIDNYKKALKLKPHSAELYSNLGNAYKAQMRLDDAVSCHLKAISINPCLAGAYYNLGNTFEILGQLDKAVASYHKAITIKPNYSEAYSKIGNVLQRLGRLDEAIASYYKAFAIKPDDLYSIIKYWHTRQICCDWDDQAEMLSSLKHITNKKYAINLTQMTPFPLLAIFDDPEIHLRAAIRYSENMTSKFIKSLDLKPNKSKVGRKIKIAYLSADFQNHATAYLMAGLFELHNVDAFEIYAISFGPEPNDSSMRERLKQSFTGFYDVKYLSDKDIAQLIADLQIDIAVDLKGHTFRARTGILAYRPAPIQVQFLGYPGSMGADFIDYIVADPVVIPEHEQVHYSEKVIYMPNCYQVNDRHRQVAENTPTRKACGLPKDGFVFSCFNYSYKIKPDIFDIWMRLLTCVEGSVLWLFEPNQIAICNLLSVAEAKGVDPGRIVFAKKLPQQEHLARIKNTDLFLDTFPCNAHTTASDALWVGVPVLTLMGRSFASRVAGSLLKAIDVPELITTTPEEYESLALHLATCQKDLSTIKQKVIANRLITPLFDTEQFTRHLESAYKIMWDRYQKDLEPEGFWVS